MHVPSEEIPREDAEAALAARRDLGPGYEPEIVESFVERLDKAIDERVAEAVEQRSGPAREVRSKAAEEHSKYSLALAIVSLCLAVPLTGIVAGEGIAAIVLVWVAIVVVNVGFNLSNRPKD